MTFLLIRTFPIFFSPFLLYLILNDYLIQPEWFEGYDIEGIFLIYISLIFISFPLFLKSKLLYDNKINFGYINKLIIFSIILFFLNEYYYEFNLRIYSDLNGYSNIYQVIYILNLLLVIKFHEIRARNKFIAIIIFLFQAMLIAVSGSKGTFLAIGLLYAFHRRYSFLTRALIFMIIFSILLIFYPVVLTRYLDVGLSAISITYICEVTNISPVIYHFKVISNFISDIANIPAIKTFFADTGYSVGYNVSPTLFGEIACIGKSYGLVIFIFTCLLILLIINVFIKFFKNDKETIIFFLYILTSGFMSDLFNLTKFLIIFVFLIIFFNFFKKLI